MQKNRSISPINKILPALFATLGMTVFIVLALLAFGFNALVNRNVTVAKVAGQADAQVLDNQATIQEFQATIAQYQDREAQYQVQLQQAADQINQANQQNLQYQQLFQALQSAGVIQVTQDGRVFISRGGGFQPRFDDDGN